VKKNKKLRKRKSNFHELNCINHVGKSFVLREDGKRRDLKVAPIARQINSQRHAEMQGL